MKRFVTAALAAATLSVPLAMPAPAVAHERNGYYRGDRDRDWDNDRGRDWRDGRGWNRRDNYHHRWDRQRYNGYAYRGQWYYGPPPVAYYNDPYFDPGYRAWRRGDRLPSYYRDDYDEVDWRDCGLSPPPRGYHYVEDDRGDYLLVGIATGIILGVILGDN